ncbi:hypothetical protein CC1G_03480 [Coprinopsis cinerea okayama7|uniref:Ubiquitin-like protease family profile domain-containing protein n=1 Tax=Coprinopsis cinerea (strain Okayama-7 / 130 / ATCC MYA-4618 / FGSC 9003) TaxID=240176 RepID=A8NCC2_COPC7|nr:hypothetical protein CC1G_03480 [Coprinopsis cinerea okayama7\|eukprot:XP_001832466.2 hypothetical protein CC1G_03480 [Coprinopsis cinerea okayama7\
MPRQDHQPLNPAKQQRRDFRRDTTGLGTSAYSPVKKRDAYKTRTRVSYIGLDSEMTSLSRRIETLKAQAQQLRNTRASNLQSENEATTSSYATPHTPVSTTEVPMALDHKTGDAGDWVDTDMEDEGESDAGEGEGAEIGRAEAEDNGHDSEVLDVTAVYDEEDDDEDDLPARLRSSLPLFQTQTLYGRWIARIPQLVSVYLEFLEETTGKELPPDPRSIKRRCDNPESHVFEKTVNNTISFTSEAFHEVCAEGCECHHPVEALVRYGLFPTAPTQPRMAIYMPLLDLYNAIFEKTCDAIYAISGALQTYYEKRGFVLLNRKKEYAKDGLRKPFGLAVQWYDRLLGQVRIRLEAALKEADEAACEFKLKQQSSNCPRSSDHDADIAQALLNTANPSANGAASPSTSAPETPTQSTLTLGECDRVLRQFCPACFGGDEFGLSLDNGGDAMIAIDGNFNHRHNRGVKHCPKFYEPEHFLSKDYVDTIGQRMREARTKPKREVTTKVPKEAVKACQKSHQAGSGSNVKTCLEKFDAGGVMAAVCRHDIPLFAANIDTAGEQQKYAVALIEKIASLMPPNATLVVLYDVGCVLDRSTQLHPIMASSLTGRLKFATSAMHAYAHQWACQLGYNPRLQIGLALSDGEGVERIWSLLRRLIAIQRNCSAEKRIWLLDRQLHYINRAFRDELGDIIRRRLTKSVPKQEAEASAILEEIEILRDDLEKQWQDQRATEMSVNAGSKATGKKEIDAVINVQAELKAMEKNLKIARKVLKNSNTKAAKAQVQKLAAKSAEMQEAVDNIYEALDVAQDLPDLEGVSFEYIRELLLLRDVKASIQKRAVGSFFEIDRLDQAVGGRDATIGTKLHQATRKSIQRRKPALMRAIHKHNEICTKLAKLHKRKWKLPLPKPLPTKLGDLRNSPALLEDVWITRINGPMPEWLENPDVRRGIRAHLKLKRCSEERIRLGREADNLSRWYGRESTAVEIAIALPSNSDIRFILLQHRARLAAIKQRWINGTSTPIWAKHSTAFSKPIVEGVLGRPVPPSPIFWVHEVTAGIGPNSASQPDEDDARTLVGDEEDEDDDGLPSETLTSEHVQMTEWLSSDGTEGDEDEDEELENVVVNLDWSIPETLKTGPSSLLTLLPDESMSSDTPPTPQSRYLVVAANPRNVLHEFEFSDINILHSPEERLNDVCMNSGGALLQQHLKAHGIADNCALLSTFTLVLIRHHSSSDDIWRLVRRSEYWKKDVWILPIHRTYPDEHWVVAVLYPKNGEVYVFDSLGARKPWKGDLKEVAVLIASLNHLATKHGHSLGYRMSTEWTARPMSVVSRQTTTHSCGLWVLSVIVSLFKGFHMADIGEADITVFRRQLYLLINQLPSQAPPRKQ